MRVCRDKREGGRERINLWLKTEVYKLVKLGIPHFKLKGVNWGRESPS